MTQVKNNPPTTSIGLTTLNHFGVSVSDLDESIAFYSALTGTEPAGRGVWGSEGLGKATGAKEKTTIEWATFKLGNVNIDLLHVLEPKPAHAKYQIAQRGAMHVCFDTPDLASVFARMEAAGLKFLGPYHRVSQEEDGAQLGEGTVVAYFQGPDGEFLELIQGVGPFSLDKAA
jgi:catechol 2,3-dioxygenase-like lactoylglutathione lyase family enzyme